MTKDRIQQLRAIGSNKNSKGRMTLPQEDDEAESETSALTGLQSQPVIVKTRNKEKNELDNTYKHVNIINELILQINEDIVQLKRHHVRMQQSTRTDASIREQIDSLNENIKSTAFKIKNNLQELDKQKKGDTESVINRVVKTQHGLLTRRFRDTMEDYEGCLSAHKKISEDIIKKQLKIVIERLLVRKVTCVPADRQVTDEELFSILDSEDTAVFVDNYTKETLEARQSLEDARDRHKEILLIEKDIALIREMFFDIAMHVTQQGELIERIEYHIGNGYVLTHKGNKKLNKASRFMKKARKKKCYMLICLIVVLSILIVVGIFNLFLMPG